MRKERKIKGHYTIVNTYDATEIYNRDSFEDYCDACNEDGEYDVNSDEDWYRWAQYEADCDYECFENNLRYSNLYGRAVIVEGSVGRWNGTFDIMQHYFDNPIKAIRACIDGADNIVIKKVGHKLEAINIHHDGKNYFTITFLTPLGEGRYLDHGKVSTKNRENFVKLTEHLF